ncbi:MAG TPA: hypothetical protein VGD26_00355 [Chitinophagaceae bacterium]
MLYLTIFLFAIAAVMGVVILKSWLTAGTTSKTVIYSHGIVAASGLVLLIVLLLNNPDGGYRNPLILFVIAALGGFYMFFRDLKGEFSPTWMAILHALLAVAGFVLLLLMVI